MSRVWIVYFLSAFIGLIAFLAGLADGKSPFGVDSRVAVLMLSGAGFLMCSFGAIGQFVSTAPASPFSIMGYVLGVLALGIAIIHLGRFPVPYLSEPRVGVMLIGIIIIIKVLIARSSSVILRASV